MTRRQRQRIKPTAATHFPSLSQGLDLNQNVYMFTQDVQLAVMPIGGRTEKHKDFNVLLNGSQAEREKAEQLIGEICRYEKHDLKSMVCNAVEEISRHIAWEGCAVYELILGDDGLQHILNFTPKNLWRLPGCYVQIIPHRDWNLLKKKFVVVPASRIWYLEMPQDLGGRRGYKSVLKRLRRFEHIGPEFWKKDLDHGVKSRNFDFQLYTRSSEIYDGQVTRAWGWNRRDWSQERCTEFFTFYKLIRFKWAQAMLREHIVAELNGLFTDLGIKSELKVVGLPSPEDVLQTERDLLEGIITFAAASDRVRL